MKALWQNVLQKSPQELDALEPCGPPTVGATTCPALVSVIKTDREYASISAALSGPANLKYKPSAKGLIDCFDIDFKEQRFGKGGLVTLATYRNNIALSLQHITNQSFGSDKQQWLQWWQDEGQCSTTLK